jgi:hypothetical protein
LYTLLVSSKRVGLPFPLTMLKETSYESAGNGVGINVMT